MPLRAWLLRCGLLLLLPVAACCLLLLLLVYSLYDAPQAALSSRLTPPSSLAVRVQPLVSGCPPSSRLLIEPFPPPAPTNSGYEWISFPTPLWQGVVEAQGQTQDLTSVSFVHGRLILHGLSAAQRAELSRHMQPYRHFDGVDMRFDSLDEVLGFEDAALDWRSCDLIEPKYAFLTTVWMPMLQYHMICDHVIRMFAQLRAAQALPAALQASFLNSSALTPSCPRRGHSPFDLSQPVVAPSGPVSPFSVSHLQDSGHSVLYLYERWAAMRASSGLHLLTSLFSGDVRSFSQLEPVRRACFRRVRWGRGPPLHYFARVFPFPLPASSPLLLSAVNASLSASIRSPAEAAELLKADPELYSTAVLGGWAGLLIDFYHWQLHAHSLPRRVRAGRHPLSHAPLPDRARVRPSSPPRILHMARSPADPHNRYIANTDCLRSALSALSPPYALTDCCDWRLPWSEQLLLFSSADVLLGIHGAGLTNALFMAPGGLVLELMAVHHYDNGFFPPLSQHMHHRHIRIDVRQFHDKGQMGYRLSAEACANVSHTIQLFWHSEHASQ